MIRYLFLSALRDRTFQGLLAVLILASLVSLFLGSTALVEQQQMQLAYIAGSHRAILVVGMILLICLQVRRQFDRKEIELFLTLPQPRHHLIFSYMVAYSIISALIALPSIIFVAWLTQHGGISALMWGISLIAELSLISVFALAASLIMNGSVAAILASLAFYVVSRMIGFVSTAITINTGPSWDSWFTYISEIVIRIISIIIPRLDLFTDTIWLVYGVGSNNSWQLVITQFITYLLLLTVVVVIDFRKKEF